MLEKYKIDNGIVYELIDEIYYPIFDDVVITLGLFASKRIEYLMSKGTVTQEALINNKQIRYQLFYMDCYYKQLCQKLVKEYVDKNPNTPMHLRKIKYQNLQQEILDKYIMK